MPTIVKYKTSASMLLSAFPGSIELKRILKERFFGVIPAALYKPTYKIGFVGKKLRISTGLEEELNFPGLFAHEQDLLSLPKEMEICLNNRYQIIGITWGKKETNYDNFLLWSRRVPFTCAPVVRIKDKKPQELLTHLMALPSVAWNSGRVGLLPESGKMLHLAGPSIAPMVFQSLKDEYRQMLKEVPLEGFEALLYFAIRKSIPELADLLIGTPRFAPKDYERHIQTWL